MFFDSQCDIFLQSKPLATVLNLAIEPFELVFSLKNHLQSIKSLSWESTLLLVYVKLAISFSVYILEINVPKWTFVTWLLYSLQMGHHSVRCAFFILLLLKNKEKDFETQSNTQSPLTLHQELQWAADMSGNLQIVHWKSPYLACVRVYFVSLLIIWRSTKI